MSAFNYNKMKTTADRLLLRFAQGTVQTVTYTSTGGDEFTPPTETPVPVSVDAVVSGVSAEWIDGTAILASDLMVTMAVPDVLPIVGGVISIDGSDKTVKRVMKQPTSGVTIVVKCVVG